MKELFFGKEHEIFTAPLNTLLFSGVFFMYLGTRLANSLEAACSLPLQWCTANTLTYFSTRRSRSNIRKLLKFSHLLCIIMYDQPIKGRRKKEFPWQKMLYDLKWGINQVEVTCDHSCFHAELTNIQINLRQNIIGPFSELFMKWFTSLRCSRPTHGLFKFFFLRYQAMVLNFKELRSSAKFCGGSKENKELFTAFSAVFLSFKDRARKQVKQNGQKTAMSSFTVVYRLKTQIDR